MATRNTATGLLGLLGRRTAPQASTLLSLGTMGIVRHLTQEADRRVATRGGAPWTPSINRAKRNAAAAVRRRTPRGSVTRSAARAVAAGSRPSEVERRAMRRESYRQQGERLSDEQLVAIPPSELPAELVQRRSEAMKNRPRDEKGRFLPPGEVAATPTAPTAPSPASQRRQELEKQLRDFLGDKFESTPPEALQRLEKQIEQQVAREFGQTQSASQPDPAPQPPPAPQPTPAQQKRENVQAVIDSQLEDTPQPRQQQANQPTGWLDKLQMGLDAGGIVDPTPVVDGANAVISLGRAAADPERRREHLQNAAISTVSAVVPYVGDAAKLLKVGRAAKKAHAAEGAGRAASRGAAQGGAESVAMVSAQPAASGGIGGTIRRVAGGAMASMFGGNGARGSVRPRYSGGGPRPPGDSDQREGAPPIIEEEVRRTSSAGAPPVQPPRFGAPSPAGGDDDGGNSPRREREEAAGIAAHDQWTEKLKDGALSIASFAGKIYLAIEGLQLFNRGVMTLNRDLAQYSGPLAGAYAKADNADIRRDMKRANTLSGPLSRLQDETSELQDSISELVTPIHGVLIEILAAVTKTANFGVDVVKNTTQLGILVDIYNWLMGVKEDDAPGARQFLQDLSDGRFDGFGIDDIGKRFEILDKATRSQMGLTAQPKKPQKGKAPAPP